MLRRAIPFASLIRSSVVVVALVLLPFVGTDAAPQSRGDYRSGGYDAELAQFRAYVQKNLPLEVIPAISIGFYKDGFIWADGFGFADLENQVPATAVSAYRLASVTKPMTAIGVLKLVEESKVDLDAEIQVYVPYFPRKDQPVTVGLLLGHLGGISHYRDYSEEGHFKHHKNTREAIAVFEDFDLVAEPGTRFHYTSYGYNLLGAVIEGASGRPYGEYMREVLWSRYGMTDTRMDDPYELIPNRVTGYRMGRDGEVIRSEFVDISSRFAAGGTRGTVVDLLKFVRGLDRDPLLAPATMDQMFTSMETRDGRYTDYGWGWVVRPVNGRFRAMHTGGQAETRTYLAYFPSIHFAVAAAVNFEAQAGDHLHYIERLYQILMHEPMGVDVYVADRYEGVLYEGARVAFEYGLAHYDRYSAPFTGDAARLEAAFDWFNAVTDRREVEADPKGSLEAMEMGRHPVGNQNMVAIGSHMAAVLEQANGTDYLAAVHGEGAVTFFADYIAHYKNDRSFPRKFRFTQAFEKSVMELEADWESTWNDFTSAVAINRSTDLMRLTQRLKSEFGKAGVYPDFQGDLQRLMMVGIRGEDLAMAISAATSAVDLYPLSDRPYVMAGICQYLLGDFDRGRSSVERAYAIDPAGAAGASSLNGYAHAMRGRGHSSAGFEVLKLAIELHPDVANLYNSAGEFCLLLGDREQAVAYYEKALEVDPEFEKARKMLDKIGEESQ